MNLNFTSHSFLRRGQGIPIVSFLVDRGDIDILFFTICRTIRSDMLLTNDNPKTIQVLLNYLELIRHLLGRLETTKPKFISSFIGGHPGSNVCPKKNAIQVPSCCVPGWDKNQPWSAWDRRKVAVLKPAKVAVDSLGNGKSHGNLKGSYPPQCHISPPRKYDLIKGCLTTMIPYAGLK